MNADKKIQQDIMDELEWEPALNATEIGVAVKNGVVTLSGHVNAYYKKLIAENAAKRIKNVKVVAVDLNVELSETDNSNDTEIGTAIANALKWHAMVPQQVQVKVEDGWVTLSGEVAWNYQREAAFNAVHYIKGVRGISNLISIKSTASKAQVKENIRKALERNAEIEASKVEVSASGHRVILNGKAGSWHERNLVERAAWSSPGVTEVIDEMEIA